MATPVGKTTDRCQVCGHDLRATARFCDECGCAVTPRAVVGEHKQVTVLFADVVGSMKLAATLDAERLREIMNELFNRASAVVQRYRGTVDTFTGDGLMALFGAPFALEDHALRACLAACEIQAMARLLAGEVHRRDGLVLALRVGLNSGDVIAGAIGPGLGRYTAVGHPVGMAQRMESAAPAGGVLCSLSTARLVEGVTRLGPVENVTIKGSEQPVPARQLFAVETGGAVLGRNDGALLGREEDANRLRDAFESGRGGLVGVLGEPGIGKSRLVSAFASTVEDQGARVVVARGEAHASMLAFRMLSLLLRGMFQVDGLGPADAREHVLNQFDGSPAVQADAQILFEAMGIGGADTSEAHAGLDGRRQRLVDLMVTAVRVRRDRTVFVLEDVHWIDTPSDEVLADFAASLDGDSAAIVVATYRPEFHGALHRRVSQMIKLRPLAETDSLRLIAHLLGEHSSLTGVAARISEVAAGNPYFIEEIVRDLAGRGVLTGSRGAYRIHGDVDRITVPVTVQAVLSARIDRLPVQAKSILNAAAVIGTEFDTDMLCVLQPGAQTAGLSELVSAELIDQTEFLPRQRYCFHHPLVRAVAYESQLSRDRTRAHSRLAAAIEDNNPGSVDENAALIAAHLEAAGDHVSAHRWYMRAGHWIRRRDIPAAREQWEHARGIADALPDDRAGVAAMRVAPRTLLVSTSLYVGNNDATGRRYREFRDLATRTEDTRSLAIGTAGQLWSLTANDVNLPEAAALASQLHRMAESAAWDGETTGIVINAVAFTKLALCEFEAGLAAIDLLDAAQTPSVERAPAQALRGVLELCLGRPDEGRYHLREGIALAHTDRPLTFTHTVLYAGTVVALGLCHSEEFMDDIREALRAAEALGESSGIVCAQWSHGTAVLRAGRGSGEEAVEELRQAQSFIDEHRSMTLLRPSITADLAIDAVRNGERGQALEDLRSGYARSVDAGSLLFLGYLGEALVATLVEGGSVDELTEAQRIVEQWQQLRPGAEALDLWWLRSRALLARARDDARGYAALSAQYLDLCEKVDARGRFDHAGRGG